MVTGRLVRSLQYVLHVGAGVSSQSLLAPSQQTESAETSQQKPASGRQRNGCHVGHTAATSIERSQIRKIEQHALRPGSSDADGAAIRCEQSELSRQWHSRPAIIEGSAEWCCQGSVRGPTERTTDHRVRFVEIVEDQFDILVEVDNEWGRTNGVDRCNSAEFHPHPRIDATGKASECGLPVTVRNVCERHICRVDG